MTSNLEKPDLFSLAKGVTNDKSALAFYYELKLRVADSSTRNCLPVEAYALARQSYTNIREIQVVATIIATEADHIRNRIVELEVGEWN